MQLCGLFRWPVFVVTVESEDIFSYQVDVSDYNFNDGFLLEFDFSILCLTRDFIRQGQGREKRNVYRATRTRSQAIERG